MTTCECCKQEIREPPTCAECKQIIRESPWATQEFDNGVTVNYCFDHHPDVFRQKPLLTTVPRELGELTPRELEALKNKVSLDEFIEDEEVAV